MYAIIKSGGKQHKVTAGDSLKVELLEAEVGQEVTFPTLLVVDGETVVTDPAGDGFAVRAKVTGHGKLKKVLVFHKKRRKQYKKLYGHRQPFTQVEILSIAKG
jgi:large subunit ribosomal protein L21